ncbi:hypothetical protein, partial [Ruthenibacterium lactatiformans]|uniref:hypothetical protein n=1 Tax=Ruthenibacterium lactatiformans TaxID=1550024 RepID=UPI003080AD38
SETHPSRPGRVLRPGRFRRRRNAAEWEQRPEAFRSAKKADRIRTILSIENKISFAHSLPAEEEERERSIFLWLSRIRRMRVNQNPDFSIRIFRMSFLLLRKIPKNQSSFAVGGLRGPRSEA